MNSLFDCISKMFVPVSRLKSLAESVFRLPKFATALCAIRASLAVGGVQRLPAQSAAASANARHVSVTQPADQKVTAGASSYFTGSVRIQALFGAQPPARNTGGLVTFQPGARTHWHTHPAGQVLIITDGEGWIQEWGQPRIIVRKGDVIQIPAGVKHWHGATTTTTMSHIALQEVDGGRAVDWLEAVTDQQYNSGR